ncbi:MAG: hypothetical protein Wins2KO_08160 [Winogradskyella sp.]|nr:hypothetical protein [Winogradskyella sp.]
MIQLIKKIMREDNFLSLGGNLTIAVFGFAGFALLARSLDTDSFAQWVLFISGGSFVEMLRFGITNNGLVRFLSGASENESKALIGSNTVISLIVTAIIAFILVAVRFLFSDTIDNSGYVLFFAWYPIMAFVNLPWNNALVVLQAKMNYSKMLLIKALNSGVFFIILVINTIALNLTIGELVMLLLIVNGLTSLMCVVSGWDGLKLISKAEKRTNKKLLNFGKYSVFTLIGSNLLKNADILIISISPLGNAAVALYSIPLKLLEIILIPLRSFSATAFPKMSKASLMNNSKELHLLFNTYSGALSYLFVAISLAFFVFAEPFVILISGEQYLDVNAIGYDIVNIVKILAVYGLLLPLDRMTGIGLDSINKPNVNALKVAVMLTTNIVGDLIAVFVFKSLEMVALFTLVFTAIGIVLGIFFLNKEIKISGKDLIKHANMFYLELWQKVRSKKGSLFTK